MKRHVIRHGTVNEYGNFGCRCDACRAAAIEYHRRRCQTPCIGGCGVLCWGKLPKHQGRCRLCANAARIRVEHGEAAYHRGCRCDVCRAASAAARSDYRRRHRDAERTYAREYKRARAAQKKAEG
jgi:hypothetical protein